MGVAWLACCVAWFIAPGGLAHAEAISGYEEQSSRVLVGAGSFSNVPVSCSPGQKVLGGGFSLETPDDVKAYSSEPNDGAGNLSDHGWNAFVHNAGTADRQVTTTAICVSSAISGYVEPTNQVVVKAGGFSNVPVSCSPGQKIVGGGFQVETPDEVKVYSSEPSDGAGNLIDNGWNVFAHNTGTADRQVTATGICVSPAISGHEEQTNRVLVGAGAFTNVPVSCSTGGKVAGGGFGVETPDDVKLYSSEPTDGAGNLSDHGWNAFVHNAGTVTRQVTAFAICFSPAMVPAPPKKLEDLPPLTNADVGRLAQVAPVSGQVLVGIPGGTQTSRRDARASQKGLTFVPLREARQIPVGSFLDTRRGIVRLRTATGSRQKTQTGDFTRGLFQVLQSRRWRARGVTSLVLKGGSFARSRCIGGGSARAGAARLRLSRRIVRRLRSSARGRFRTRGRHSAATVRGTVWETVDRCDGTLTKVRRGVVAVRDFRRRKTVVVKAGHRYLARAPG